MHKKNYLENIKKIKKYARTLKMKISIESSKNENIEVVDHYDVYKNKVIVGKNQKLEEVIFSLLHEFGHGIDYINNPEKIEDQKFDLIYNKLEKRYWIREETKKNRRKVLASLTEENEIKVMNKLIDRKRLSKKELEILNQIKVRTKSRILKKVLTPKKDKLGKKLQLRDQQLLKVVNHERTAWNNALIIANDLKLKLNRKKLRKYANECVRTYIRTGMNTIKQAKDNVSV